MSFCGPINNRRTRYRGEMGALRLLMKDDQMDFTKNSIQKNEAQREFRALPTERLVGESGLRHRAAV